ncbi:40S ribosomal protein S23 [Mortierella sp. NVP85]|nr:40S ribosomal protein S23 [Mortierella sp. NVP85]
MKSSLTDHSWMTILQQVCTIQPVIKGRSRTTATLGASSNSPENSSSHTYHLASLHFLLCTTGKGKPRGLQAARKLRTTRRDNRWADKHYKRQALGTAFRFSPFGGSSHAKGIVLEKIGVEAKQPNSAIRKCVRVQLIKNGKKITAFVPNDGCLNFVDENDEVLIAGFGRSGHAVGDLPGVRFKVVKVSGVSLLALWKEKKEKPRS